MNNTMETWSIAVRTVGGKNVDDRDDFTVTVSPDDDLSSLHHEIESVTGLKASQQRLIYRGRLITDAQEVGKVRDVVGLGDGQTIHLVPKPESEEENTTDESNNRDGQQNESDESASSSSGASSLLAALLGLGSSTEEEDGDSVGRRLRSSRLTRTRPNYRLTESDHVVPDPGTLEPVRQGLMTLHTMMDATTQQQRPWETSRRWYRGQWIDCRDTVNQWLEATIVDIARPEDILSEETTCSSKRRRRPTQPATDPAVSANDFEGRRRLLLEPDGEDGFCERQNNDGVQLLLVHYNGWPHRWDEWIRSDSERIRPFRTRTRHGPTSGALPTPQTVLDAAPSTNIKEDTDEDDRVALLPELSRAVSSINNVLEEVVPAPVLERNPDQPPPPYHELPWLTDADDFPSAWSGSETERNRASEAQYSRRQLESLAPLLDRLGRALTDAAPQVAYYASTLPEEDVPVPVDPETDNVVIVEPAEERSSSISTGLFSLLSRESRSRATASRESDDIDPITGEETEPHDADYVDFVNGMVNTTRGDVRGRRSSLDDGASLLGAYLALSSLASEASSDNDNGNGGLQGLGRLLRERGANGEGGGIDIHIHAVVTGPVVGPPTAMAMMGGGEGGGPPSPANSGGFSRGLFSGRRGGSDTPRATVVPSSAEEDAGIFDDLYSENPAPLDPHGNPDTAESDQGGNAILDTSFRASSSRPASDAPRTSSRRQRSGRPNSRRGSSFGRAFRSMISPRRRSSRHDDSDSESH